MLFSIKVQYECLKQSALYKCVIPDLTEFNW